MPKPSGHALVVGCDPSHAHPREVLKLLGYEIDEQLDPYAAMLELCRRPLVFRAMVISLQNLYRDELNIIATVRRRFPHVSIWLTNTDGRQSALAEAMRLGAEALLGDDGVHNFSDPMPAPIAPPTQFRPAPVQPEPPEPEPQPIEARADDFANPQEPVLTAEELRALLGEDA